MASTTLNAKVSIEGAALAERRLKGITKEAKATESNVVSLGNGFKGTSTETKSFAATLSKIASPAKAGATAIAGMTTALAALTIATASQVTETRNMAALTDQTIAGFEGMSFAASQFGLTNEQLSDQFKDVNEKIGEFLTTGGGGLQDYIDTMGLSKKAGMEFAQSLRDMSGQDALQLMINNMEDANKSTREVSFAVEGLASDLTKALPLFTNNAEALKSLNKEFALVTSPLTDEEVDLYAELNKNVALTQAAFRSLSENALIPVIGYVTDLAGQWTWLMSSMNEGTSANITSRMADIQDEIDTLTKSTEMAANEWQGFNNVLSFGAPTEDAAKARIKTLNAEMQSLRDELNTLQGSEAPTGGNKPEGLAAIKPTVASAAENDTAVAAKKAELDAKTSLIETYNASSLFLTDAQYALENEIFNDALEYQDARLAESRETRAAAEAEALQTARENFEQTNAMIQTAGSTLSSSLASGFTGLVDGSMSAKEAALDVVSSVAQSVMQSGIDILVQSLITDKLATAAFLQAKTAEVTATSLQAGQNAFSATAAIPVVGPALAPAAAATATATASALGAPVLAAAAARYQGGNLSAGQSSTIAEQGDLEIITPASSSRVRTADQMKSIMGESGGSNMTVNIINQGTNTSVTTEQKSDEELVILINDTVSAGVATSNSKIDKSLTNRGQKRVR